MENVDGTSITNEQILSATGKREWHAPASHDQQGRQHADALREHRGNGDALHAQQKLSCQQQVAADVEHAGDGDGHQGHGGIAHAAEHAADDVIRRDEGEPSGADADIRYGPGKGRLRRLHESRQLRREDDQHRHDHQAEAAEQDDGGPDDAPHLLRIFLSDRPSDQDGHAHGEARHETESQRNDPSARGNSGNVSRGAERTDHQHIHRAVSRLQQLGQQDGDGEPY